MSSNGDRLKVDVGLRTPAREGTAWTAVMAALRTDLEPEPPKPTLYVAEAEVTAT